MVDYVLYPHISTPNEQENQCLISRSAFVGEICRQGSQHWWVWHVHTYYKCVFTYHTARTWEKRRDISHQVDSVSLNSTRSSSQLLSCSKNSMFLCNLKVHHMRRRIPKLDSILSHFTTLSLDAPSSEFETGMTHLRMRDSVCNSPRKWEIHAEKR
jgi:hypothetical protein